MEPANPEPVVNDNQNDLPSVTSSINKGPWGFWASSGLTVGIVVVEVFLQIVLGLIFALVFISQQTSPGLVDFDTAFLDTLTANGLFISSATIVSARVAIVLVLTFIIIRQNLSIKEYLALNSFSKKKMLIWSIIVIALLGSIDILRHILDIPDSELMVAVFSNPGSYFLLISAIVVYGPIAEEVVFRGFLFKGIQSSKMGNTGAVLITSFLWAILHLQYGIFDISSIFVFGILLGIVRIRTKSLFPVIILHCFNNLVSTIQFYFF